MTNLTELADWVETLAADDPTRVLNREVALAIGWYRRTPSKGRSKYPTWVHPDDCRDGKPIYDSLHGTNIWREPLNYLTSLEAAMMLVVDRRAITIEISPKVTEVTIQYRLAGKPMLAEAKAATPALALCAAALRIGNISCY